MRHLIFCLAALLLLGGCRPSAEPEATPIALSPHTPLPLSAPAELLVGQPLPVEIGPLDAEVSAVVLTMNGSYGVRSYTVAVANGRGQFTIPASDTEASGLVTLRATAGAARGETSVQMLPDLPISPLTPLVGSRSIIADGEHWAMVVSVPFDQFGNPIAEDTPVNITVKHPGGWLEEEIVPVEHLLAWKRIFSGTTAGRSTVVVTSMGQSGPEKELFEIAGWPQPFGVSAEPPAAIADGRQLITLRTDIIVDEFDNPMPDGTQIVFVIEAADGTRTQIPSYTLNGAAETYFEAPINPGEILVWGTAFGVEGAPLTVPFSSGIAPDSLPLQIRVDAARGEVVFLAGPLLGALDQFVPDGTEIMFLVEAIGDSTTPRVELVGLAEEGQAEAFVRLAALEPGSYRVTAKAGDHRVIGRFEVPAR